jgi:arylformamidase
MIYDISMLIEPSMQVYKHELEKVPVFKTIQNHSKGNAHETQITMNLHTGTHVDYPLHMIENGKTSDAEDLNTLIGPCKVLDLTSMDDNITEKDLRQHMINKDDFVLLKTINSVSEEFSNNFIYLEASGARYLKDLGVRGVGIDALGIERAQANHDTHKTLLSRDIVIIEGLRLKDISAGPYTLYCLPLTIKGVEASPARVILEDL